MSKQMSTPAYSNVAARMPCGDSHARMRDLDETSPRARIEPQAKWFASEKARLGSVAYVVNRKPQFLSR